MKVIEEKQIDELEAYKGKWGAIYFLTNGDSAVDDFRTFPTQAEAAADIADTFCGKYKLIQWTCGDIPFDDLSHGFPIPVKP